MCCYVIRNVKIIQKEYNALLDTFIALFTLPVITSKVNLCYSLSPLTFSHIIFNTTVNKCLVLKLLMKSLCGTQFFEFDDAINYSKLEISKSNFHLNSRSQRIVLSVLPYQISLWLLWQRDCHLSLV
ncbi:unnamed protein product [Brugia pahangi]|uniref:Uncharacterized protein n=1 Tax=Brugia pahangi TaxID=6280 RepID=A0A0N4TWY4_BRUPA|nr:unnamed protein product [Brugia pahangi]